MDAGNRLPVETRSFGTVRRKWSRSSIAGWVPSSIGLHITIRKNGGYETSLVTRWHISAEFGGNEGAKRIGARGHVQWRLICEICPF